MAAMQNSRISLISKSDIRYEGTLFSINPEENTVALRNVRMLGTEDRRTGTGAVQGSEQIYEYIVFRGSDIKDLTVFEQVSQNQNMLPPDPAILSGAPGRGNFSNQGQRNQGGNRPSFGQGQGQIRGGFLRTGGRGGDRGGDRGGYNDRDRDRGYDRDRGDRNVRSYNDRDRGYDNRRGGDRNDNRRGGYDNRRGGDNRNDNRRGDNRRGPGAGGFGAGGQGGFGRNRNGNLHTGQNFQPSANPSNEYKEEFDFATANQSLDKDKLAEEFTSKATIAPAAGEDDKAAAAKSVYTPKNFFDELSCEALDAKQGTASKPPDREAREAQKRNDVDTFGDAAMNVAGYGYGGRRRGMGRGRGRGGRGGRRY